MPRQSLAKSTGKHIARLSANRLISAKLGTGLFGAIAKTLFSQGLKNLDKLDIKFNKV